MNEKMLSMQDFYKTKVKDVMKTVTSHLPCIEENSDVSSVLSLLKTEDHVWVMSKTDPHQVTGIITESDTIVLFSPPVVSLQSFDKPDSRSLQFGGSLTAEAIMSKNPVDTTPEETIKEVLQKMKQHHVKQVPVVDQHGLLQGEISLHDMIHHFDTVKK